MSWLNKIPFLKKERVHLHEIPDPVTDFPDTDIVAPAPVDCLLRMVAAPPVPLRTAYQLRVNEWCLEVLGPDLLGDRQERMRRFLEEAVELVQAGGMTRQEALFELNMVYTRSAGEVYQEVGGVMTTLHALGMAFHINIPQAGEDELSRAWDNVEKIKAKNKLKPRYHDKRVLSQEEILQRRLDDTTAVLKRAQEMLNSVAPSTKPSQFEAVKRLRFDMETAIRNNLKPIEMT